ncbi:galactokinase [bacterium]|nr:galactokinase [bacterium]
MSNIEKIYGSKKQWYLNRKDKVSDDFFNQFKEYPNYFFSSPGRIEVLGNHTDHNNGLVMVSAVDLDIFAAVKPRKDNQIVLNSEGYSNKIIIQIDDLEIKDNEEGKSEALIRGILYKFKELGYNIGGFSASMTSNIFKGAGLSSSAAFELLICQILNFIYNDNKIAEIELAKISQFAENKYFMKPSGLLDQTGIALGGFNFVDFKDVNNPQVENFSFSLKDYRIVLINTGGSHANLTKNYAAIREDMQKVAQYFKKETLREVSEKEFYDNLYFIKKKLGGRAILRSMHYFEENKRVKEAYEALKNNDIQTFFNKVNESGKSSYEMLQNCYIDKDTKQGIALAYNLGKKWIKNGAIRVHGGGFKGTVIAYVHVDEQIDFIEKMKNIFGERHVTKVNLRPLGASIIEE